MSAPSTSTTSLQNLYTVANLYHQLMRERGFDKPIWAPETNVVSHDHPVDAGAGVDTRSQMRAHATGGVPAGRNTHTTSARRGPNGGPPHSEG